MPLLVESLKAVDGRYDDIQPHRERMRRSRQILFGRDDMPELEAALTSALPATCPGTWKVRILYDTEIRRVEAGLYVPKSYRSAALVDGGNVDYRHKWAERPELDELTRRAVAAGADTALIVKNGLITDFSYANAMFFDGSLWWTPAAPLLCGTRRARLLASGTVKTADITPGNLNRFVRVSPVNAMLELDEVSMGIDRIIGRPDMEVR